MLLKYRNTEEDYEAFYEDYFRWQKKSGHDKFYVSLLWYVSVLGLMVYVCIEHEEFFLACLFAILFVMHLWENWSYQRNWDEKKHAYSRAALTESCQLNLGDDGIEESFSGVVLFVPWEKISEYSVSRSHIIIYFPADRAFIVPLRDVEESQKNEVMDLLKQKQLACRELS